MITSNFELNNIGIGNALEFIENFYKNKLDSKNLNKTLLLCEETMIKMVNSKNDETTPHSSYMTVSINKNYFNNSINITARGQEFTEVPSNINVNSLLDDNCNAQAYSYIQGMIIKRFSDNIRYKHKHNTNSVDISINNKNNKDIIQTVLAILFGVIFGFLCKFVFNSDFVNIINNYFLTPVKDIFLNAINAVIGPLVFFSIAASMFQFTDAHALGKTGSKVFSFYIITSVLATLLGIFMYFIINPAKTGTLITSSVAIQEIQNFSVYEAFKNTFLNIVPNNLIEPFFKSDMLQLIFLAILIGLSATLTEKYTSNINTFFNTCNELFMKVTSIILKFIPLVLFCSLSILIISSDTNVLFSLGLVILTCYASYLFMFIIYCLMLKIIAKLNPLKMIKKSRPVIISALSTQSSCATMPVSMNFCESIGIPKRIYSFSIPLGATINMDGACISFIVTTLAFMKFYNIDISFSKLIILSITTILLSMSVPGIPGSAVVIATPLFITAGIPLDAISIFLPVISAVELFETVNNLTGDIVVTTIISKLENCLDIKKFNS